MSAMWIAQTSVLRMLFDDSTACPSSTHLLAATISMDARQKSQHCFMCPTSDPIPCSTPHFNHLGSCKIQENDCLVDKNTQHYCLGLNSNGGCCIC